ncbi:uncharacterized protein Dana_GF12790, isoform R [Drosophila ananassae]|uniref:Uncharacterized protein, isoform R n=1 Tax=Drosophila ananassae TaxID=7217 RepID=A0A0P8Y2H3_DROAN|nr:PHD finger protein rhinoceros isoform X15 [Drosophila ananassae]KPU75995.1 uncharacterized protein Dana_GF12790, isoform R [Drosophila ananassae]
MPNNRNRNRNRNRNKRNRNQNPNPNPNQNLNKSQAEEVEKEEQLEEQAQPGIAVASSSSSSIDDNGNSGTGSNGPTHSDNNDAENSIISDPKVTNTPQQQEEEQKDIEDTSEMGAKNSKHQKDKSGKQGKQVEEQVRPGPTIIRRPPGSPRQAKVIVHRIVKAEDQVDKAEVPQPEPKVLEVKVELGKDQVDKAEVPQDQPKVVEIKVEQEVLKEDAKSVDATIQEVIESEKSEKLNEELKELVEKAQELQQIAQPEESKPIQEITKAPEEPEKLPVCSIPQEQKHPPQLPEQSPTSIPEVQAHPIQPSPPQQRTSKVIIHKIRLETDEEERERKGKPTIEEISSTSGSSLAGTLSPPPRYLVESPKNVTSASGGQFARFSRDVQIQELELASDCSSGEFNVTLSPLVCEADSETEGSGSAGGGGQQERSPPEQPSSRSRVEQQEQLRQKRAQKRNALESHFLPQLMNPRYLDSILEENGEQPSYKSSSSNSSSAANSRTPKLNESFPKSQLDFSRRHKRREEAPAPLKLETKFLEQPSDLESCSRLQSTLSPQSEDAELVYLSSSASSSVSDLMELELEQAAALAERALVDLDTDASRLINPPDDEMSSTSTTTAERSETEAETETETERELPESRESTPVNGSSQLTLAPTPPPPSQSTSASTPSAREESTKDTNVSNGSLSASFGAASPLAATREEFVRNMDKVRELIEMTRREQEEDVTVPVPVAATGTPRSPSPPPVPPPPVGHQLYSNTHIVPLSLDTTSFANLKRQESNDSHCSDSTTHSQCTAINLASPPLPTPQPPTPPLRQKPAPPIAPLAPVAPPVPVSVPEPTPTPPPTPESTIAAPNSEPAISVADSDSDAIKKLRLLCTETLASMPYGEQVLEELASVAQNIASKSQPNMPYPMPQLPHIKELELNAGEGKSSSAWLGLPTQSDPQLLVCLSPGQRQLVDGETQPDQLLDAHQKFVERRGYHELSKAQVLEQEEKQLQEKHQQQQQSEMLKTAAMMRELRKSLSPSKSPPPVPPPPVPVKSAETAAKANANTHPNAKRDDASGQKQKIDPSESSSLENKPRRAADLYEQQQSAEHRQSSSTTMTSSSTTSTGTGKFPTLESMESELARMFPHRPKSGDIFEEQRKRFSNIEFPSHVPLATQSQKRYSNIETSSYESKKRTENGQVVYDVSTSSHEKKEQGDPPKDEQQQSQAPAPPVPPPPIMSATKLNGGTFIDGDNKPKNSHPEKENSASNGTYEEFRQRAKAAVDAIGGDHHQQQQQQQNGLDHDRVFKDFDRLSQQMHAELQSTRERREKSASLYDLSGLTRPVSTGHQKVEELQQRRHAHMQELEREIERSARSRQERMSSVPRQLEATPPHVHEIPIELESRSRRAESLCNLNEPPPRPHTTVGHYGNSQTDDWARYASDLGYSENIARPFAREVEICYQRQNPRAAHGIRAPRLSASTNDLSSSSQYSFDSFNAYGGRRTHAPMLNQVQQQPRPHYGSCYSMIERDPNPRYISTTSRRGVSPAPGAVATPPPPLQPPPAYDRQQRRASLPRELHEQQLKYILSKEEELKLEVERLQHERRRLMEEMQRAPVLPAPQRRESYRPAAKLPTLSEDEVFRQQMAEEWMNKVAEREERRHNKIIRISKIEDEPDHAAVERGTISDEFLDRVKERRHKLAMPADSDWESGAESQPQPNANQSQGESDVEAPPVRILEGQAEANLRQLPRHLREFAKFSTSEQLPDGGQMERHEQQERHEEATDNSHSSASKKTSIVKTYKVSRLPPSVQARPSYKSNGYVSEPEPNYDSDYSTTVRYRTQNPHRVQSVSSAVNVRNLNQDEKLYGTMPNPIKSAQNSYKNQPGRIEDYTTGHSSVSEKEKKENLEQSKLSPLYTEGNLSRALAKESGYTSDSNLVFRKKELPVSSPLSPVEQRQAYKSLQAGGEPPLLGFRKPAPEKPRDLDPNAPPIPPQPPVKGLSSYDIPYNSDTVDGTDVNIHFKTPIRHEQRQNIPEDELAIRQAEHMQKLYQEERRRKYLQELQDMNSRRHTDNFTPSQKSPIALNRYDDFPTDVTLKSLVGPKTVARALFNFQGQSSKELSFRKGDTIYIRRQIDPNWYEGEHNAMIGLLPVSYVEIVSRDGARTPSKRPSEGQARAKYNFQAQSGIELSLNKGELVTLTRRVDGNWFEGKIANRKGIFPVSYVEVLTDIGAEDIAARTTVISTQSTTNLRPTLDALRTNINNEFNTLTQNGSQPPNGILKETRTLQKTDALHVDTSSEPLAYRALYKYRPQNSDELELLEGDVVHVLEKCDDGWFVGTSQRTGCFGTFPGNYVERA